MRVAEYFALEAPEQARWRAAIAGADWRAARYLHELLTQGTLRARCGASTRLLLGIEGDSLAAFCTLAERDEVETALTPWIGFVYTFPGFRGRRLAGCLIEHACALARAAGFDRVYVSTDAVGLYEKYGFAFLRMMPDENGRPCRVYSRALK